MADETKENEELTDEQIDEQLQAHIDEELAKQEPPKTDAPVVEEEEEEETKDAFDTDMASAKHLAGIQDPEKRRALIEDLARREGLITKMPEEERDAQHAAAEAGKKSALNKTAPQMVEELKGAGYDFPEMADPYAEGAFEAILSTYMDHRTEQRVAEMEAKREQASQTVQAEEGFEAWKRDVAAVEAAKGYGNPEAAEAVFGLIKDITMEEYWRDYIGVRGPQDLDQNGQPRADLPPTRYRKMLEAEMERAVKGYTVSKESDEPLPRTEDVVGKKAERASGMQGQKDAYERSGLQEHMSFDEFMKGIEV